MSKAITTTKAKRFWANSIASSMKRTFLLNCKDELESWKSSIVSIELWFIDCEFTFRVRRVFYSEIIIVNKRARSKRRQYFLVFFSILFLFNSFRRKQANHVLATKRNFSTLSINTALISRILSASSKSSSTFCSTRVRMFEIIVFARCRWIWKRLLSVTSSSLSIA